MKKGVILIHKYQIENMRSKIYSRYVMNIIWLGININHFVNLIK